MLYSFFLFFLRPFYHLVFRIKIHGKENLPPKGKPVIVCANHISAHDIVFIAMLMKKRRVNFVAKEEIVKNPFIRFFALRLGVIPIKRGTPDLDALRSSVDVIKKGGTLGIFPQGTRQRDKKCEVSQFKSGVGLIAYRSKADVFPVYIKASDNKARFFHKIEIFCGKTIEYSALGFENGRFSEFNNASKIIAENIIALSTE